MRAQRNGEAKFALSYMDVHDAHERLRTVHEASKAELVARKAELDNAQATVLKNHREFELRLNKVKRHWTLARHKSSLSGAMMALVVAKILWATAVNLGEDNLNRGVAGVFGGTAAAFGGMLMLSAYKHFKKANNYREQCLSTPVTLARMAFGSHLYPATGQVTVHVGHAKPVTLTRPALSREDSGDSLAERLLAEADIDMDLESGRLPAADPHRPVFVTADNWKWLLERSPGNKWVTTLMMSLVGAAASTGACMAFTGIYNTTKLDDAGQEQGAFAMIGLFVGIVAAIGHCALVDRWQRLPDKTGCTPSAGLMEGVLVHDDEDEHQSAVALAK